MILNAEWYMILYICILVKPHKTYVAAANASNHAVWCRLPVS